MPDLIPLGSSDVAVSRLGIGVMTWGEKTRMTAYGGTAGRDDEAAALEAGLAGGVTFYDTAEMYGSGNSERSLGTLARGEDLVIGTKFLPRPPPDGGQPARRP